MTRQDWMKRLLYDLQVNRHMGIEMLPVDKLKT